MQTSKTKKGLIYLDYTGNSYKPTRKKSRITKRKVGKNFTEDEMEKANKHMKSYKLKQ